MSALTPPPCAALTRRGFLAHAAAGLALASGLGEAAGGGARSRPNILWIVADDLGTELGCYGDPLARTPNLDRLAAGGVRFDQAFGTAPVCSPSRSAFTTGMYQTTLGAHHHRGNRERPLPPGVRHIARHMHDAGYYTANGWLILDGDGHDPFTRAGKGDLNFRAGFPFDGIDWSGRAQGRPFFAIVDIFQPHRRFVRSQQRPTDPDRVELPPYYPDHPLAREVWAWYLDAVAEMDRKVGLVLDRLEREGLADDTIVVFFGDNGRPHPRDKQFLYEGGIHVPLIVRWPGVLEPGTSSDALVSLIDLAPTCLAAAGIEPPRVMQGRVAFGHGAATPRSHIIAARDRCDETEDRIRCVRTRRWKYIRNFHPERPWMQPNLYKQAEYPVWNLLLELETRGELTPAQARFTAATRPPEELFDLQADPHELNNLAADPACHAVLAELRGMLDRWIAATGDKGALPEDPDVVAEIRRQMEEHFLHAGELRTWTPGDSPVDD